MQVLLENMASGGLATVAGTSAANAALFAARWVAASIGCAGYAPAFGARRRCTHSALSHLPLLDPPLPSSPACLRFAVPVAAEEPLLLYSCTGRLLLYPPGFTHPACLPSLLCRGAAAAVQLRLWRPAVQAQRGQLRAGALAAGGDADQVGGCCSGISAGRLMFCVAVQRPQLEDLLLTRWGSCGGSSAAEFETLVACSAVHVATPGRMHRRLRCAHLPARLWTALNLLASHSKAPKSPRFPPCVLPSQPHGPGGPAAHHPAAASWR